MKPFYIRHKNRDEAIEVIDRAVAHGATLGEGIHGYHDAEETITDPTYYEFCGVSDNNLTMFYCSHEHFSEEGDTQELTLQQVRELYPLPGECPTKWIAPNLKEVEPPKTSAWVKAGPVDPGQHYRFTYKDIKLDPFRIAAVYGITDFGQQTILKKALRMGTGHKDRQQDLKDIICAAERMLEMMDE